MSLVQVSLALIILLLCEVSFSSKARETTKPSVLELVASNVTSNLANWETDLAVMFYAPWCKYCKQLSPSWSTIADLVSYNQELALGKFDCEAGSANRQFCVNIGIAHYPTILFVGFGDFHQVRHSPATIDSPSIVRFNADLYVEAIYDWIQMLSTLSKWKRRWFDITSFFRGQSIASRRLEDMSQRLQSAERKVELFSKELQRYKANELFDSIDDQGDIFPLLHDLAPDRQNLPLRACVADLAGEFCKYYEDEEYCQILDRCLDEEMEPLACRPAKCPFADHRGCVVTSSCLRKEVITEYKKKVENLFPTDS